VNVAAQSADPDSLLSFYRRLIWLRKAKPALSRGSYRPLIQQPVGQMAYLRETTDQAILVCLNFFSRPATLNLDPTLLPARQWKPILSSTSREGEPVIGSQVELAPYEALLLEGV